MRFTISRASDWSGKNAPCDGAQKRSDDGLQIEWEIEIADLDALITLIKTVNRSVVVDENSIIIYDHHLE